MRILVVQTAYLGDVVMTTPLLRELRRVRPGARIVVLTTAAGREVLRCVDAVDETLVLDKAWTTRSGLGSYARALLSLARHPYDAAIAAQRSHRTGVLVTLSRAPQRIGFSGAPGAWAYTERVNSPSASHSVYRYLALAAPMGGNSDTPDAAPALGVDPDADRRLAVLLDREGPGAGARMLCVAPGSARSTKRWLPEGFAAVVAAARERDLAPVLLGSPDEQELCEFIARQSGVRPTILAGRLGVAEMVAALARARVVVANDSGPGHVAAAVGTPVLSVFGPSDPSQGFVAFGPRTFTVHHPDLDCRPCSSHGPRKCPEGHFKCMRELPASTVIAQLDRLLEQTEPRDPIGEATDARRRPADR